jgi:glucose/arabinose dehydrogenase
MRLIIAVVFSLFCLSCNNESKTETSEKKDSMDVSLAGDYQDPSLPKPFETKSARNNSKVIGWPEDKKPLAPEGFTVTKFAADLASPRWIYTAPNGDIFVSQINRDKKQGNNILLFRDANKDGTPESSHVYLSGLNRPFGMLIVNNKFYVANTDAVVEFPYDPQLTSIQSIGKPIASLPSGGHWTRNIISNAAGNKLYISVGSLTNVADDGMEKEQRRASILEINPDGSGERIYASGLRNPVGMAWAPGTNSLWTAVNERDELGDELVPDYITSVKEGGFYGWPYSYFGQNEDPRIKGDLQKPDLVAKAIVPDVSLGAHTASLGLAFYNGTQFPEMYRKGAFVGQHGSWNHSKLVGYKVVFVPFKNGKPSGQPIDFLTGFIADEEKSQVYGRPVGVTELADGSLLVADDDAGIIWRVAYNK